jgi:hypothetical protein
MVTVSSVEILEGAMPSMEHTVYEYCFDQTAGTWVGWMSTIPEFQCNPDKPFSEVCKTSCVRSIFVARLQCSSDNPPSAEVR